MVKNARNPKYWLKSNIVNVFYACKDKNVFSEKTTLFKILHGNSFQQEPQKYHQPKTSVEVHKKVPL